MNIPVLYIVFNRPDLVQESLRRLQEVKPKKLFIAADGPRSNNPEDDRKCAEVRNFLKENIDWNCQINLLYRDHNLGCGKAVSEAISWFFKNVEYGIILEDDCIPSISFFTFCEDLLKKYKDEKNIFHISGSNWQQGIRRGAADYYFSNFPAVWGWATWRDRWESYKLDIISKQSLKVISNLLYSSNRLTSIEKEYYIKCFSLCEKKAIDTWDYQWRFLIHLSNGLSITPNKNLITNIGHRMDGTHTRDFTHWRANLMAEEIKFPLNHPKKVKVCYKADRYLISKLVEKEPNIVERIKIKINEFIK